MFVELYIFVELCRFVSYVLQSILAPNASSCEADV